MQISPDSETPDDGLSTPGDEAELEDIITRALTEETPLSIEGLGSKHMIGTQPRDHHRVSLKSISGITDYEPNELVLSAKAGTPLREIVQALDEKNQHLAFEPPALGQDNNSRSPDGTIGGCLATNLSGPRRFVSGAPRDHFLGVAGISGRGEHFKAGGRVVKNVTGYDICKLLAGSYGTLAVMTQVTVKVLPSPPTTKSLGVTGLNTSEGVKALNQWATQPHPISGAAHLPKSVTMTSSVDEIAGFEDSLSVVRLEGTEVSVASRTASLTEAMKAWGQVVEIDTENSRHLWAEIRDAKILYAPDLDLWRVSVPPTAGPGLLEFIGGESRELEPYFDSGGGLLWLPLPDASDLLRAKLFEGLQKCGGAAVLVRPANSKEPSRTAFSPLSPGVHALNKRLKQNFDPKRILNPGRMYADL